MNTSIVKTDPTEESAPEPRALVIPENPVSQPDDAANDPKINPSIHSGGKTSLFVQACDLLHPRPLTFLIDELLEEKSLALLFAQPAMGKSFLALAWSCSVATGQPWLGREVSKGPVFYLAGEGHAGISRRLKAWELKTGVSLANAPLFVSKAPARLMEGESIAELAKEIEYLVQRHGKPSLIVVDTFARNMGSGDENSNADIAKIMGNLDSLKALLDCAILLVHHTGHSDDGRARGGSALPAAMDSIFRMTGKKSGKNLVDLRLVHTKSKESSSPKTLR